MQGGEASENPERGKVISQVLLIHSILLKG